MIACSSITFDHDTEHLKPQWYAMDLTALREGIISDKDMSRVGEKYGGSWSKGNAKDYLKLYYADASADVLVHQSSQAQSHIRTNIYTRARAPNIFQSRFPVTILSSQHATLVRFTDANSPYPHPEVEARSCACRSYEWLS